MSETKPFSILKRDVATAFGRVKANKGTYGIDGQSIEEFEKNLKDNLYVNGGDKMTPYGG